MSLALGDLPDISSKNKTFKFCTDVPWNQVWDKGTEVLKNFQIYKVKATPYML